MNTTPDIIERVQEPHEGKPCNVLNQWHQPCPQATSDDYPLSASCITCGLPITCADSTADWDHSTEWRVESTHLQHECAGCCDAVRSAVTYARATGSRGARYEHGVHVARVRRVYVYSLKLDNAVRVRFSGVDEHDAAERYIEHTDVNRTVIAARRLESSQWVTL